MSTDMTQFVGQDMIPFAGAGLDDLMKFAQFMATGKSFVPDHFKGSPGDCLGVTLLAMKLSIDPFTVAQHSYPVRGRIAFEARFIAAILQSSRVLDGYFHEEYLGDWSKLRLIDGRTADEERGLGIRLSGILRGEVAPRRVEVWLEGVKTRRSPLWANDPKQQIWYLAVSRWANKYAPSAILGIPQEPTMDDEVPDDHAPQPPLAENVILAITEAADKADGKSPKTFEEDVLHNIWSDTAEKMRQQLEASQDMGALQEASKAIAELSSTIHEQELDTLRNLWTARRDKILRSDRKDEHFVAGADDESKNDE